jgi:hypothetical protein
MTRMLRLIDGVLYEGKESSELELVVRRLGNGHAEASGRRLVTWEELREATPDELEVWKRDRADSEQERREANRKRAARRATTRVRHLVKASGMDALLTLTYRSLQPDLGLCKRHMKEFVRRMRRLIPGWGYVAAFEQQRRGSWHVHMAIRKLPMTLAASNGVKVKSYKVVRAVWRGVVGADNGNVDESRRKAFSRRSGSRIANYISKYMLKAFEAGDDWSNRYSSGGLDSPPPPERIRIGENDWSDLIRRAYEAVCGLGCETWTSLKRWTDDGPIQRFWISTEVTGVRHG